MLNEGNSFHFGVNFEEDNEAASSQELGEEDLNNIVEERKHTKMHNVGIEKVFRMGRKKGNVLNLRRETV